MTTATRPNNLEALEHLLQEYLQSHLSLPVPVQVQCRIKDEMLVILAQHQAATVPESQQVFSILEQAVREQQWSQNEVVKIYLRVVGQKQPYTFYSFKLEQRRKPRQNQDTSEPIDILDEEVTDVNALDTEPSPHPWDQPIPGETTPVEESPEQTAESTPNRIKPSLIPLIVIGTGFSLLVFFASLFILTRPCTIGSCTAISQAQKLHESSQQKLQNPLSGQEILEAQEELTQAIGLLKSIPFWSSEHDAAQKQLQTYQAQAERVEDLVTALKTAAKAAQRSENPPHPAARWIEIQGLWREAIARLEQLPTSPKLQPLVQQKIKEYQKNLAQANLRLGKERQAQQRLQEAKDAALIADARQGVAQSLEHWQLVSATWQMAMKRLKQIPQGTMAYEEAQQLSALYLPKLAIARDKKAQEQFAANAYKKGLNFAQLAKNVQLDNQWSSAVVNWRNAVSYMKQIPKTTFYYTKAQSQAKSYSIALGQAKEKLQWAMKVQQTRSDLKQTCTGKMQVCNFSIINNNIKVRLTPAYTKIVQQTAIAAQTRGDSNAQAGIVQHIMTLGEALEAISENAGMRLEVYDADGTIIQTHIPNN